jgi:hypothetical protein
MTKIYYQIAPRQCGKTLEALSIYMKYPKNNVWMSNSLHRLPEFFERNNIIKRHNPIIITPDTNLREIRNKSIQNIIVDECYLTEQKYRELLHIFNPKGDVYAFCTPYYYEDLISKSTLEFIRECKSKGISKPEILITDYLKDFDTLWDDVLSNPNTIINNLFEKLDRENNPEYNKMKDDLGEFSFNREYANPFKK